MKPRKAPRHRVHPKAATARDGRTLTDRERTPFHGVRFDFSSLPVSRWEETLDALRAFGFSGVGITLVWAHHVLVEGGFDFGSLDPKLNVVRLLQLAAARTLDVVVYVGPAHDPDARLPHRGIPEAIAKEAKHWVVTPTSHSLLADEPSETTHTPSLASVDYLAHCDGWLARVGQLLAPHTSPRGPVLAVHLESQHAFASYDRGSGDHHPEAHSAFRDFLHEKYERLQPFRERYENPSLDFSNVLPPTQETHPSPLVAYRDWVQFQHQLVARATKRFCKTLRDAGLSAPCSEPRAPSRSRATLRHVETRGSLRATIRDGLASEAGSQAMESIPWIDLPLPEDEPWNEAARSRILTCLAAGAHRFCLGPAPHGFALLSPEGAPTAQALWCGQLTSALERTQFHWLEREPCVHILLPESIRELSRAASALRASTSFYSAPSPLLEFDNESDRSVHPELAELETVKSMLERLESHLLAHQVPFRYSGEAELDALIAEAAWVVVPTTQQLPRELSETIEYALRRGAPLSFGPYVPEALLGLFAQHAGTLPLALSSTEQELARQVQALVHQGYLPHHEVTPASVRVVFFLHSRHSGEARTPALVFVLNPDAAPVHAELAAPGYRACDALTQEPIRSFAERLQLTVPGGGVRMLELHAV